MSHRLTLRESFKEFGVSGGLPRFEHFCGEHPVTERVSGRGTILLAARALRELVTSFLSSDAQSDPSSEGSMCLAGSISSGRTWTFPHWHAQSPLSLPAAEHGLPADG